MSTPFSSSKTHLGLSHSVFQLLHATKTKLQDTLSSVRCGRYRLRDMSVLNHDSRRITVNQVEVKQGGVESIDACMVAHAF